MRGSTEVRTGTSRHACASCSPTSCRASSKVPRTKYRPSSSTRYQGTFHKVSRDSSPPLKDDPQIQCNSAPDIDSFGLRRASLALAAYQRLRLPIPRHRQSFEELDSKATRRIDSIILFVFHKGFKISCQTGHHRRLSRVAAFGCDPLTPDQLTKSHSLPCSISSQSIVVCTEQSPVQDRIKL